MRFRALVCVSVFGIATVLATAARAEERLDVPVALDFTPLGAPVAPVVREAPADMSFGQYPLSVMGIENAIRRADARADEYASGVRRYDVGPVAYSVVAIRDWERRYPADPWIAKDLLALCKFYAHVGTSEARGTAARAAAWLRHDYPASDYARSAERLVEP